MQRLLAVDIGNTSTSLAVVADDGLVGSWRTGTALPPRASSLDEIPPPDRVVICSVVPARTMAWHEILARRFGRPTDILDHDTDFGVRNAYEDPRRVGLDRLANAGAARRLFGAPVLIVDLGTATKIDVVDAEGAFLGGAILPGPGLMAEALGSRTAQLPTIELSPPRRALGRNTQECLQSGVVLGAVEAIEGLLRRLVGELGVQPPIVVTGGFASAVLPAFSFPHCHDPYLTLKGIAWATPAH